MPFVRRDWNDNPAGGTAITADELDRIELGIEEAHNTVAATNTAVAAVASDTSTALAAANQAIADAAAAQATADNAEGTANNAQGLIGAVTVVAVNKGELRVGNDGTTAAALAPAEDGRVLQVDSGTSLGIKWGSAIVSGTAPAQPIEGDIWLDDVTDTGGTGGGEANLGFNAKGDLIIGTGVGASTVFPIGDSGRVLQADTSSAVGVKWGVNISHAESQPTSPEVGDIWVGGPTGSTGGGGADIGFTSKGQLAVGTGDGTNTLLNVGELNRILQADPTTSAGIRWGMKITPSTTQPVSPVDGDVWLYPGAADSSSLPNITTSSSPPPANPGDIWLTDDATPKITASGTAPNNPANNDIWVET